MQFFLIEKNNNISDVDIIVFTIFKIKKLCLICTSFIFHKQMNNVQNSPKT